MIQKLYAQKHLKVDNAGNAILSKKGSKTFDITWHLTFETVESTGLRKRSSKVGSGPAIDKPEKTPASIGNGEYVNVDLMTQAEYADLTGNINIRRILNPRFQRAIGDIRALVAAYKNPMVTPSENITKRCLGILADELAELDRVANGIKKGKAPLPSLS